MTDLRLRPPRMRSPEGEPIPTDYGDYAYPRKRIEISKSRSAGTWATIFWGRDLDLDQFRFPTFAEAWAHVDKTLKESK